MVMWTPPGTVFSQSAARREEQNTRGIELNAGNPCPSCHGTRHLVFHRIDQMPVHCVLLMPTRDMALNYPKGAIALAFCESCGFIWNTAFDPGLLEYSPGYEETQGFSPTFNAFHRNLATSLIERFDLRNKVVLEIGCGKGEFISLLCELGNNTGVAFDPAYIPARNVSPAKDRIAFIQDFYSDGYGHCSADFVCCKMTLEHIPRTRDFVGMVRRSLGDRRDTIVFFQVPDLQRILRDVAFWDIYYEHCSYFTAGSLARLFRRCGFEILDIYRGYDQQYLMLEARAAMDGASPPLPTEEDVADLAREVRGFRQRYQEKLQYWQAAIEAIRGKRPRVVIWGSSSKGVSFLTTLRIREEIEYVVDINPHKHGMYMPGTGQRIVSPDFLRRYRPERVIVMNPIYWNEIQRELDRLDLSPELVNV